MTTSNPNFFPNDSIPDLEYPDLEQYLSKCVFKTWISDEDKERALKLWSKIKEATGDKLMEPDAAPCGDSGLMLAYDYKGYHLEFEFYPDQPIEVFFMDRKTEEVWDTVLDENMLIAPDLMGRLKLFIS